MRLNLPLSSGLYNLKLLNISKNWPIISNENHFILDEFNWFIATHIFILLLRFSDWIENLKIFDEQQQKKKEIVCQLNCYADQMLIFIFIQMTNNYTIKFVSDDVDQEWKIHFLVNTT